MPDGRCRPVPPARQRRRSHQSVRPFLTDFCFGCDRLTLPPGVRRWLPSTRTTRTT